MNLKQTIHALENKGYTVKLFSNGLEAAEYLETQVHNTTVGFGGSTTLAQLDMYQRLLKRNTVWNPDAPGPGETFSSTARMASSAECYLLSANALTEDGILVNLDAYGNRLAESLHGHKRVYYVIGTNKIEADLERAVWRVRNIAAPKNAVRLRLKTPCAAKGDHCYDCSSPDRICNSLLIHLRKVGSTYVEVLLVDEPLGF